MTLIEGNPGRRAENMERWRRKAHLANLEADAAYFQARLEILGEPETINQLAQRRLFVLLHEEVTDLIGKSRRRMLEDG